MRIRVRFAKFDSARFLGHLDVMRYFQKAFRRAELPIAFSEGYHPHPLLSFAQPLSLSYTSDGEYFDLELRELMPEQEIYDRLNAVMCDWFTVNKVTVLPDYKPNEKKVTGMSLIVGAAYFIRVPELTFDLKKTLTKFSAETSYVVTKTTKKGTGECDLRKGIHGIRVFDGTGFETVFDDGSFRLPKEEFEAALKHADRDGGGAFAVYTDAGSEQNVSAELVLSGICAYAGIDEVPAHRVHRMELFGRIEEKRVPLWMIES